MLRPYQADALKASKSRYDDGVRRQLIQAATGLGKTICFASIPEYFGFRGKKRMLVLVHRDELAQQAADKLRKWNHESKIGVEMGDDWAAPSDDLVVAGVQTLGRKGSTRLARFNPDEFAVVVIDECHHSSAETYMRVVEHFGFMSEPYPERLLIGFTATPNRSDGTPLATVFDEIVFQYPIRKGIEDGWLADVRGVKVTSMTNLDAVSTRAGDFAPDELEQAVNTESRNLLIVKSYVENASQRKAIVFCTDIAHSKAVAHSFQKAGIPADAIWGADPDRAEKLRKHENGDLMVLCNAILLGEGYDSPTISCIIMGRPTKSSLFFTQCVGRGLRIPSNIDNLVAARERGDYLSKSDCLFIDVVDSTSRHSLITIPTLFGMPAEMDLRGGSAIAAAKQVEEVQAAHPNVDLSHLPSIDQIQTFVESVDLFAYNVPPELAGYTDLRWFHLAAGAYVLPIKGRERIYINENILGRFSVRGQVNESVFEQGGFNGLLGAIGFAETMLKTLGGRRLYNMAAAVLKSGGDEMTDGQRGYLRRLLNTNILPAQYANITKQQARNLIQSLITGQRR